MKRTGANLLLLLVFIFGALWVKDLYDFSKVIEYPEKPFDVGSQVNVDLIVVLTGGQGRFRAGVELLKEFPKAVLLISGTESFVTLDDLLRANNDMDLDDRYRSRIWLGKFSKNTVENAIEVRDVAERVNARNILLVTSSYHARRALDLLRRELEHSALKDTYVYYHPVESPNFPSTGWWRRFIGWRIFLSEYFKSIRVLPSKAED